MAIGTVKWFNFSKGFGFIQPEDNSRDVFLHISALEKANINQLNDGQKISYQIASEKGKESAVDIKLI
jgi:CspA family cold shock protein